MRVEKLWKNEQTLQSLCSVQLLFVFQWWTCYYSLLWIATPTAVSWVHLKHKHRWLRDCVDITVHSSSDSSVISNGGIKWKVSTYRSRWRSLWPCWAFPPGIQIHWVFSYQISRLLPVPECGSASDLFLPSITKCLHTWECLQYYILPYNITCPDTTTCRQ